MATISEALAIALKHHQAGQLQAAEQIYRQILAANPQHADALHLLGVIAFQTGQLAVAAEYINRSIAINPNVASPYSNLGLVHKALGNLDQAVAACRRAIVIDPNHAEAHGNLGSALCELGELHEGVASCQRALELNPDLADPYNSLGIASEQLGQVDEAVAKFRRSLELKPDYAPAHNNLARALMTQGNVDDAIANYRKALEIDPSAVSTFSNYLQALHYRRGTTPAELALAHAEYERRYAAPLRHVWRPFRLTRDSHRLLRMGFVSPDLGRHPVGDFLIRLLENHDRQQTEIVCYSNRRNTDDRTDRFRKAATEWQQVAGWSDERLADQIYQDQIDILFDLAGHTAHNRLLVFARKPAPIQITWVGYDGTTGLSAMNYILADRYVIPPETESHYCERVLRMPDCFVCYGPPSEAPPVSPLPASSRGRATFGCLNNPAKISAETVEVWAKILQRLPKARLMLKFKGMDAPSSRGRLGTMFGSRGVDPGRLEFEGASAFGDHLASYHQIDVALDPIPFCGGATTCEALWMGVPVITYPGETFASRRGLSYLSNVGLMETIARDFDHYVEIAVALANDLPRLAAIRARLREQMAASPLCDGPRFASNFTALMHEVWRRWVDQSPRTGS